MIESGSGIFQVDFTNYNFKESQSIFLSPGQYFRLLTGSYSLLQIEFEEEYVLRLKNSRFLFEHLISLGYIDIKKPEELPNNFLLGTNIGNNYASLLNEAVSSWLQLNPFKTSLKDNNLLFEVKMIIDKTYLEPVSLAAISREVDEKPYYIDNLFKEKLKLTYHNLTANKVLLETKRKLAFTDLSTKEIAYSTGFNDPSYFNRFFKNLTSVTPMEFRENFEFDERDAFIKGLLFLIDTSYKEEHFADFYAEKMGITIKTLSKKISNKLDTTFTHLISEKLFCESKMLLQQKMPVNTIAFNLGFKEPNHFSAFFKKHSGKTPTQFLNDLKKVH